MVNCCGPLGAVAAVNELAALGHVVLGLDARKTDEAGLVAKIPINDFKPSGSADDVDRARDAHRGNHWTGAHDAGLPRRMLRLADLHKRR